MNNGLPYKNGDKTMIENEENEEILKLVGDIFFLFDEKNANTVINAIKITMMMVIYQVNDGNLDGCYEDLDKFHNHMEESIPIVGSIVLPKAKIVVEKYN